MFGETAKLAVDLSLTGNFNQGMSQAEGSLNRMNSSVGRLASKIGNDLGRGIRTTARNLERMAMVAGAFAVGAGVAVVKWAGDFQAQLNTINTIAFETPAGLEKIGTGIKDISSKTGIALDDLTQAYYDLLSAGIKVEDAQGLLNNAVTLGIGGIATTAQTVDLLTTAYNAYHLDLAGATVATDQFAQAVADGKVTADEIASSFANVASIAATYKIGIDQVAAAYGYLTAQGVQASEVTTEMQRAIVSLIKPLPALEAAQKALKINFTDEISKKGLVPALQELRVYADKNKIPLIELLGRIEAVKFALQTTGPNFAGFEKEQQNILNSTGMAAKQAEQRQQGFDYQLKRLTANVKIAGITIGNALLPQLAELSKQFADFIVGHEDDIKKFGVNLAEGLRKAVMWAKSLDWNAITLGLKAAVGFVQSLVAAFGALPTETKELLIGLYGLNKLSGGAVINIGVDLVKGLGGGIFKQFFSRGSSPANPLFVSGGLGGGVGGATGALGTLLKVAVVGAVVVEGLQIWMDSIKPFLDQNNALGDKGLTSGEIEAQKYYTADKQTQSLIFKRLGHIPSIEDFRSGNIKLGVVPGPGVPGGVSGLGPGMSGGSRGDDDSSLRFVARQLEQTKTGGGDFATAVANGFARSNNPSLKSMQFHLAKIQELIPLTSDKKEIAKLTAAQAKIAGQIAEKLKGELGKSGGLSPDERDAARQTAATADNTREGNRIATQTKQSIDYAKVDNRASLSMTQRAIDNSRDAIVAAIRGISLVVTGPTARDTTVANQVSNRYGRHVASGPLAGGV